MKIPSIAIAIALAIGCGKDKTPPPPPPVINDPVQVVTPGAEPRQVLQYHLAKGTSSLVELALEVDIDAGGQGGPLPTLVMSSEIVADDVLPDGSMAVHTTILDIQARDRTGSPVSADQMSEQTQMMRGLTLRGTLTRNGTLREMKVDTTGRTLPPALTAQLDTLSRSFEQVAMPLPLTPVGAGAQWIHSKTIDESGMKMTTATTVTLTAIEGDKLTFQSTTAVSGKDQSVTQAETTIDLKNVSGKGSGKGTVDLSRMVMAGELVAEFGADMSSQGENTKMGMKMVTRISPLAARPAGAADVTAGEGSAGSGAVAEGSDSAGSGSAGSGSATTGSATSGSAAPSTK
jgi:hypothetical protein